MRAGAGAPAEPPVLSSNLGGALPGDSAKELYWEARVARWLGVARARVRRMRSRALREGEHWQVIQQDIVYTVAGLQRLRDLLTSTGELPRTVNQVAEPDEPAAPAGPPKRTQGKVVRVYPNRRLLQVSLKDAGPVLVLVRDNSNFIAGMVIAVTHDARANQWQFCGRLPRAKGRLA